jgi:hypothetical protein
MTCVCLGQIMKARGLLARMGNMTAETTLESVETGVLADTLFSPPADYKLSPKK